MDNFKCSSKDDYGTKKIDNNIKIIASSPVIGTYIFKTLIQSSFNIDFENGIWNVFKILYKIYFLILIAHFKIMQQINFEIVEFVESHEVRVVLYTYLRL